MRSALPGYAACAASRPSPTRNARPQAACDLLRGCALALLLWTALVFPACAQADPPALGEAQATTLPAITVTGSAERPLVRKDATIGVLGERPVLDTPFSIQSYSRELIEAQGSRTLADAVRTDAGVKNVLNAGGYASNLSIRGFEIYDSSWDGLPGGFALGYQDFPLDLVDAVEVMKGPASILLGTYSPFSSVAGSVNYAPRRAPSSGTIRRAGFGVQSGGAVNASADLGGRFGEGEAFGWRVNAFGRKGGLAVDRLKIEEYGALLSGEWRVSPSWRLIAEAGVISSHKEGYTDTFGIDAGVAIPAAPEGRTNVSMPWADWNADRRFALLKSEWRFDPAWKLTLAGTASRHDFDYISAGFPSIADTNGDATLFVGDASPFYTKGSTLSATLNGELRTGPVDHSLVLAASRDKRQDTYSSLCDYGGPYATNIYRPVLVPKPACAPKPQPNPFEQFTYTDYTVDNLRAIHTLTLGRWSLMLGLGHVRIDDQGRDFATQLPLDYRKSKTTPLAAVMWKPVPQMTGYVSYAEGFRQGGKAPVSASNAFATLPPRASKQTEAGFKWEPGAMQLSAALFRLQDTLEFTDANNVYVQDGKQTHKGLELSASGPVARDVDLIASLMLLRPEVANGDPASSGKQPAGVPRTSASVYATWRLPLLQGLSLSAGAQHKSAQYLDLANDRRIGAYTVFDAGLSLALKPAFGVPAVLRLNVDNLADKAYWSSVSYACCLSKGEPRTVKLAASYEF